LCSRSRACHFAVAAVIATTAFEIFAPAEEMAPKLWKVHEIPHGELVGK